MGNEDNDLFEDSEVVRAEKERIKKQLFEASEEIWSPLTANNIMFGMYHELEKAGVEDHVRGDVATAVAHAKYLAFRAFILLRTVRQGMIRCANVKGLVEVSKLDKEAREKLSSIMSYWSFRWAPFYSDKVEEDFPVLSELKNNSEKDAVKRALSTLKDIILEYKAKLDDETLQYELFTYDIKTPSIIESPKEYIALTDEILNCIETEFGEVLGALKHLPRIDVESFTVEEYSFTQAIDYETKLVMSKIPSFVEESKKAILFCRDECKRMQEGGTANVSDASADSDTSKYEVERLKEDFELLSKRIEKLEQAQQSSNSGSINEKLDVLSRKVKELESKFGNLKKVVYDVINKGNSSAVEELGIGNVEEVEFTNSESSTQEDDSKSNRLNDAFADLDKQLADLQEIFNA